MPGGYASPCFSGYCLFHAMEQWGVCNAAAQRNCWGFVVTEDWYMIEVLNSCAGGNTTEGSTQPVWNHSSEQWKSSCRCRRILTPPLSFKIFIICWLQEVWLGARAQLGSCYISFSPPVTTGGAEGPLPDLGNNLTRFHWWTKQVEWTVNWQVTIVKQSHGLGQALNPKMLQDETGWDGWRGRCCLNHCPENEKGS